VVAVADLAKDVVPRLLFPLLRLHRAPAGLRAGGRARALRRVPRRAVPHVRPRDAASPGRGDPGGAALRRAASRAFCWRSACGCSGSANASSTHSRRTWGCATPSIISCGCRAPSSAPRGSSTAETLAQLQLLLLQYFETLLAVAARSDFGLEWCADFGAITLSYASIGLQQLVTLEQLPPLLALCLSCPAPGPELERGDRPRVPGRRVAGQNLENRREPAVATVGFDSNVTVRK
jgi:hypothetical protein